MADQKVRYNLVFRGELAPTEDKESVKRKLAELYKTDIPTIERKMFAQGSTVLRTDLDQQQAEKLQNTLKQRAGILCHIEPVVEQPDVEISVEEPSRSQETSLKDSSFQDATAVPDKHKFHGMLNFLLLHKNILFRIEFICAVAMLVCFLLPWVDVAGQRILAGFQILNIPSLLKDQISLSGEIFCYLVYLLPIFSLTIIVLGILGKRSKIVTLVTGALPLLYFAYYEYLKYYTTLTISDASASAVSKPWWNPFAPTEVVTITEYAAIGNLHIGASLTLFTSVIILIAMVLEALYRPQSEHKNQQATVSFGQTSIRLLFGEWSHLRKRQLIGLGFGVVAIACFTIWNVPKIWQDAPTWSRWMLQPFGETSVIRFPSLFATVLSLCVIVSLSQRRFLDCHVDNVFGILSLIINSWGFALVIELVVGRMDNFFEGGIVSFVLVTLYALSLLGVREVVPFAMGGIVVLLLIQLIAAESKLSIPGYFGAITLFLSLTLQFRELLPKLQILSSSHSEERN
ncbi:MAG: hypothetical protein JW725_03650 [Candidatus Babeliaceae bacterium]|nr:hypothetical protein [Candidatus Babeliaceae bacterium]